jgi:hypothetical protein
MSLAVHKWVRILLAGPIAVVTALVVMAGMMLWLPGGTAGIDNLVLPLVLLPLIWAALFFHACLDCSLPRVAAIALGLLAIHGGLITSRLLEHPAISEHK